MPSHYAIELDFGTASVRALLVDVASGEEIATGVSNYRHGADGVIVDSRDALLARQHPRDYLDGTQAVIDDVLANYELNTGRVIIDCFKEHGLNPAQIPGVLVASHAPFAWGPSAAKALENALVLELVAKMQLETLALAPDVQPIADELLDKHFLRKHGPGAYYGQKK